MSTNLPVAVTQLSGTQKIVLVGGSVLGLAVLAPIAVLALQTVTSIFMALVVGLGITGLLLALPALGRWWRVQVLKMLKASAQRNPVETLQLELIGQQKAFDKAGRIVVALIAQRDSLREELADYFAKHQVKDPSLEKMVDQLSSLVDRLKTSLGQTGVKLGEFERFVARQADRWKIAQKTGELAAMLRETQGGDVTSRFLADTAVDTIRSELNTSFAEIDQILEREEIKAIVADSQRSLPAPAIDLAFGSPAAEAVVQRRT